MEKLFSFSSAFILMLDLVCITTVVNHEPDSTLILVHITSLII